MHSYSAFSLTIHSELELFGLPAGGDTPDLLIRVGSVPKPPIRSTPQNEFIFRAGLAGFQISRGCEIIVDPVPGSDPVAVHNILLCRVMSFLMRQRGWLPLHASALAIDSQAVLFVGACLAGKSTTAAAFHLAGHRVIADDLAAVRVAYGRCEAQPGWSCLRLFDDALRSLLDLPLPTHRAGRKCSVYLHSHAQTAALPVQRIYFLEYADELQVRPISPQLATVLLDGNSFRRSGMDRGTVETQFARAAAVAGCVPVRRLLRPRHLAFLPAVVRLVEHDLTAALSSSTPPESPLPLCAPLQSLRSEN
jgi:hypothetical protein